MLLSLGGLSGLQLLALVLIGSVAGVLGGLLGIGGGLVMIPAMVLVFDEFGGHMFGENSFHLFKLAALATAVVLSIPAVRQHARARAIVPAMLRGIIPFSLVGAVAGVGLARLFADEQTQILRRVFGAFMILAVVGNIWQQRQRAGGDHRGPRQCPRPTRWARIGSIVGLPSGVISGLLGVGGGVWAVPSQNFVLGVRLPSAIANSACMIVALASWATTLQAVAVGDLHDTLIPVWKGFWLAVWLAPGAILGGSFGARLTHRLPVAWIRNAFYVLLVVTGLRLALG